MRQLMKEFPFLPPNEIKILACFSLKINEVDLILIDRMLDKNEIENIAKLVNRRKENEPIAYIIGEKEFYGLNFKVNKNVLIPRPDTEILVDEVLKFMNNEKFKIIDFCTGSSAILTSILYNNKISTGIGIDISKNAIEIAKENYKNICKDFRADFVIADVMNFDFDDDYDIFISNPPYIESENINHLQNDVKNFEPHLALDGGIDGVDFYKKFAEIFIKSKKCKIMFLEIGFNQYDLIKKIFHNSKIISDFGGRPRVCIVKK